MRRSRFLRDGAIAVGAFLVAFALAELFGATNLGTALTFGQIAFMAAIVGTILFHAHRSDAPGARPEPPTKAPPPPPRKRRR